MQITDIKYHFDPAMPGTRGMKELWCHSLGTKVRKACPKYTGVVTLGRCKSDGAMYPSRLQLPSKRSLTGASPLLRSPTFPVSCTRKGVVQEGGAVLMFCASLLVCPVAASVGGTRTSPSLWTRWPIQCMTCKKKKMRSKSKSPSSHGGHVPSAVEVVVVLHVSPTVRPATGSGTAEPRASEASDLFNLPFTLPVALSVALPFKFKAEDLSASASGAGGPGPGPGPGPPAAGPHRRGTTVVVVRTPGPGLLRVTGTRPTGRLPVAGWLHCQSRW